MKTRYIFASLLGFFGALVVSCKDQLTEEPASYYATANFFTKPANANMAIVGIYDTFSKLNHYGQSELAMPTSDDNYVITGTGSDNTRRDICHYMVTPANTWLAGIWVLKYQGIDRANFAIENISKIPFKTSSDSILLTKYDGEARFLRAVLSYDLVKYWGDVPYKTTSSALISDAYNARVDREKIYDQIVADLNIAKAELPWASAGSTPERATSGAARAMLMRVLLSRAGYSLKMDGQLSRPDDTKRKEYFNAIIAEFAAFQQNGYHNLFPNYYQFFKNNSAGVLNSLESIFEIAFYTPDGNAEDGGVWGSFIGPLTDIASKYSRANAFFRAIPEWDAWYDVNDIRRVTNICKYSINANNDSIPQASKTNWYPGKWRRQWITAAPKDPNNTDVNFCLLRYADVLLMYAEALNETGNTALAVTQLNLVRARNKITLLSPDFSNYAAIYKAPKVKDLPYISDADLQGKFRTALYWERGFELCYEGTRKYDLLRWGILNAAIMNTTTALGTGYAAKVNFVTGKHELFPIPQAEMDANSKLEHKNNPGYN
jgi:starch-binding outer membrane protein, SusD/RagB family